MLEPFLVKYAAPRRAGDTVPGYYSPRMNMWVVEKDGAEISLIDSEKNRLELVTKTDTVTESDDQKFSDILQLATKTATVNEQDDEYTSRYLS